MGALGKAQCSLWQVLVYKREMPTMLHANLVRRPYQLGDHSWNHNNNHQLGRTWFRIDGQAGIPLLVTT